MADTQVQHYVPRFLLRRFGTGKKEHVHVFDKQTGKRFTSSARKIAAEKGLYDFKFKGVTLTLEPGLAELEARAARHIARITQERRLDVLNPIQRGELARFLAVQMVRTPAFWETSHEMFERMENWLRKEGMREDWFYPPAELGTRENAEKATVARAIRGGSLFEMETVRVRRDGTPVEIAISGYPIRDDRGAIVGAGAIVRDVSARKREEAARERLHAEREALLDSAAEGIFGMDARGDLTFINPAAVAMLGFTRDDVLGRDMHELIHHSRPDGSPYPIEECPINTAFEEGRSLHLVEEVLWRKDGTPFPALYSVSTVVEAGVVTAGVVTIVDIARPQNLIEAWGKNASFHFVFTRQNRGKLDELSTLVERGQLRPHVGAVYSLADIPLAHARLETSSNGVRGKIVIAVDPSADTARASS